jgi:hypothetical protein
MRSDRPPFFRKQYIPWYDTSVACWIVMGFLFVIGLFALSGLTVAGSTPDLTEHMWFPGILAGMSFFLVIKIGFRLWQRNKNE